MRILHVIPSMNPELGGPCQGIRNSAAALRSRGNTVEVVCADLAHSRFIVDDPFEIHALGKHFGPWAYNARLYPWLLRNLRSYESVISHGNWLHANYAIARAIRRLRKETTGGTACPSLYIMPHGMLDPWLQIAPSRRFKAWRNRLYWQLVERRIVATAEGLLFTCQRELELARQSYQPYRPREEWNVGYGIVQPPEDSMDLRRAFDQACPHLGQRPFLLYLSRIHSKKGADLLLRAYARIVLESRSSSALPALVMAGPLNSCYARRMQRLAESLGILHSDNVNLKLGEGAGVHFPGMLQGAAKWGAYYASEAFVLPSHRESFGIVVAEALACCKPVLISRQIDIFQEIVDSNAGLVGDDTLEGTVETLKRWLTTSPPTRAEMNDNARRCYRQHFQSDMVADRLLSVLGNSHAR